MHLRGIPFRRSFTTKILFLSLVFATFIFYIKFITSNTNSADITSDTHSSNSQRLVVGKLINEYNGDNDVEIEKIAKNQFQPLPIEPNPRHRLILNEKFERWIRLDLEKQEKGLGDDGRSAVLTDQIAKEIGERQLTKIALNEELSEHLYYNRTLSDARNPLCQTQHFIIDELPTTSVIIIFYNEPYSVLVRTVHSVLNTVDRRLLKEIILVDDSSSKPELKEKLDYYIETRLPQNIVKIIRLNHR